MNEANLNDCGCCEGVQRQTPAPVENPANLTELACRVGTHSQFKQSLLASLTGRSELDGLKTRRDDDPTIAMLDAAAMMLDVLSFYRERITQEGYLRTATEARSLPELAGAIGYRLRPGVAASTCLAFTMETPPTGVPQAPMQSGFPRQITLPSGMKAQTVPGPGEHPQIFETIDEIIARPEWNKIRPRLTRPQELRIDGDKLVYAQGPPGQEVGRLFFRGTATGINVGDLLLVTTDGGGVQALSRRVVDIRVDFNANLTEIELEDAKVASNPDAEDEPKLEFDEIEIAPNAPAVALSGGTIEQYVMKRRLRERDLQAFLEANRWDENDLTAYINQSRLNPSSHEEVFAFRERLGFFGNNAPAYQSLRINKDDPLFPLDWDDPNQINDSIWLKYGHALFTGRAAPFNELGRYTPMSVYLDRTTTGIRTPGWAIFSAAEKGHIYRVVATAEASMVGFGMSARVTGLKLLEVNGSVPKFFSEFRIRQTTAHVKSESLELAPLPLKALIPAGSPSLSLDGMFIGMRPGQLVALSGDRYDSPGVINTEILEIGEIIHHAGYTTLFFASEGGLRHSYIRTTVTLNANVARTTHGESTSEVVGSGDRSLAFQKFELKQSPITHLSSPTAAGIESTLEIRVNDLLWHEQRSLYQANSAARVFTTRRTDDGKTIVQFGDGTTGARLSTGLQNVTASYRVGSGTGGNVRAQQVSLLLTRPLGLRDVTNPVPAYGGADPESTSDARQNAPLTVRTLDRIVSLQDYEDYARAYPGIGKAQAVWLWDGECKIIHITVAAADGGPVPPTTDLYQNLRRSIRAARDPGVRVCVDTFQPVRFQLQAKLLAQKNRLKEKVQASATEAMREFFDFRHREFAQPVTRSEVLAILQSVDGVEAVDLDTLHLSGRAPTLERYLPAKQASWNNRHRAILPAELLLIDLNGIRLLEMQP